jgi:hypothetical protein
MQYQGHIEVFKMRRRSRGRRLARPTAVTLHTGDFHALALTDEGEACAKKVGRTRAGKDNQLFSLFLKLMRGNGLVPHYDKKSRTLYWGRHAIKHFEQPAASQELILVAAEEQGWREWMDDPLPPRQHGSPKIRLHETIQDLNRYQTSHLIRFKSERGTRFSWELR